MSIEVKRTRKINLPKSIPGPYLIEVGYPEGSDGDILQKAVFNHYGTSRGIPARPFLLNAIRKNGSKYMSLLKSGAARILRGEITTRPILGQLGGLAQGDVQDEIITLRTPPNAPSTIAAKGSSNPLIETGKMKNATTWRFKP